MSITMAGPSASGGITGSSANRKHGFNRFSLGRLFNISSFTRRAAGQRCSTSLDVDRHSESSSVGFNAGAISKNHSNIRESFRFPAAGPSSSNSETNSFCSSGHVDLREAYSENTNEKDLLECPLCLFELPCLCFPELSSCTHRACYNCLQQYLKIEITESRVNISCPECTEPIHPSDIRMILNDEVLLAKYESFMLRRVLVTEPDARWCPAPDCGYAVIARGCASCPKLKCERPGCNTYFCYHCKQEWHPNQTCDAARAQRAHHSANPRSASVSFSQDSIIQTGDDIKPCPCCKVLIIKMDDGSCNHMTCSVCGTEFCWLCMKEISDLHYLSPSGCTFWGKKPWSRKKKIMWQLGMLVGAPVGIALIAGIAVPAIIIGIPVWVGRKLHAKYSRQQTSKHRRNLIVTSGVMASILVSPILAGIAVGIGVPILLAYVYGVVPISLCRSGGCGVSTSASGVRIEFDEENEIGMGNNASAGNFDGASVDTTASQRGVNPSIGEVSLGMSASLSLGSGSHLDRIGIIRDRDSDRESASNVALAGSIASASLIAGGAHKLEVQADVSSNKRFSLSSHSETASATVSLSERSANMSLADDASTKALAGSLLGYRDNSAITPVEVHVDAQVCPEDIHLCDTVAKDHAENSSVLAVHDEEPSMHTDKVGGISPLPVNSGTDGVPYSIVRLKSWKSKKRSHSYAVQEDSIADHRSADTASLKYESYSLSGHVHFSDLTECCVSYIDESPGSEVLAASCKLQESAEDHVESSETSTLEGITVQKPFHTHCNASQIIRSAEGDKLPVIAHIASESKDHRRESWLAAKSVSRSVSFCNSCSATHRPCCPTVFQSQRNSVRQEANTTNKSDPKTVLGASKSDPKIVLGASFPEPTALVNRAYKSPRSMQDISLEITAKEDVQTNTHISEALPAALNSENCVESLASCQTVANSDAEVQENSSTHHHGLQPHNNSCSQGKKKEMCVYPKSGGHKTEIVEMDLY